jgi:hypothetical protein
MPKWRKDRVPGRKGIPESRRERNEKEEVEEGR